MLTPAAGDSLTPKVLAAAGDRDARGVTAFDINSGRYFGTRGGVNDMSIGFEGDTPGKKDDTRATAGAGAAAAPLPTLLALARSPAMSRSPSSLASSASMSAAEWREHDRVFAGELILRHPTNMRVRLFLTGNVRIVVVLSGT